MKEQLVKYVDLLFAGAPNATDIKLEILQNTLDRYDDLVAQGKSPQAAYQLAISGIGDINEILGCESHIFTSAPPVQAANGKPVWKKVLQAIGTCMYIICPVPLFVLSEFNMGTLGLCGTLAIVALATALMVIAGGKTDHAKTEQVQDVSDPQTELRKALKVVINTVGLVAYLILSFLTQAWYITWVLFPIIGAVQGLIKACLDLKEARKYEK